MLLDNVVLVYKVIADLIFYVAGTSGENELILQAVLQALDETMANLLKSAAAAMQRASGASRVPCAHAVCLRLLSALPV